MRTFLTIFLMSAVAAYGQLRRANSIGSIPSTAHVVQTFTFTTPGAGSIIIPAGSTATIECWAGGGGGATASSGAQFGGGGGGAAYSRSVITYANLTTNTFVVGNGGAADNPGTNTTWNTNIIVAAGGAKGTATMNYTGGGVGGTAAAGTGDFKYSGGTGAGGIIMYSSLYYSGGGGGAGGSANNGTNGNPNNQVGGAGGAIGGGAGGTGAFGTPSTITTQAQPATQPGGGGGGGLYRSPSAIANPTAGANGEVKVSY